MTNDRRGRRHIPRTSPSVLPSRDPIRRPLDRTAKQNKALIANPAPLLVLRECSRFGERWLPFRRVFSFCGA